MSLDGQRHQDPRDFIHPDGCQCNVCVVARQIASAQEIIRVSAKSAERERCARIAEGLRGGKKIAAAIRDPVL